MTGLEKETGLKPAADEGNRDSDTSFGTANLRAKPFGALSLIGMAYSIANTAITCVGSLTASLGGGGRVVFVWGLLLVSVMAFCIAISLGELSSAMPHAGGQYYWASRLAPPKFRRELSYLVGFLSWGGAIVTAASATLAIPQFILGMAVLVQPKFVIKSWMVFLGYQITNIAIFFLNLFEHLLPKISVANLWISMISTLVIFITLLVKANPKASAKSVFLEVDNVTGWPDGVAFISALVGPNWGFACLDAAVHMAEEVPNPEKTIPKVLVSTVAIGITIALPFMIGIMFCVNDLNSVVSTPTGVPSLQLFYDSIGNKAGACVLQTMVLLVFVGATCALHTWQSRMAWSFARDNGWPFSRILSQLAPAPLLVPLMAHIWSCAWVAALGCLYLGSALAFNSFVSGGILLQYLSYAICIVLLILKGRGKLDHGPFWYPRLGLLANIITLGWISVTLVFYSLPVTNPTTPTTMNYVSAVICFMFIYAGSFWIVAGRKDFISP
ncbi:amino acid/polyamine transporter I [Mariannaea sp. PMI_226]|nr:amino acid/polyamine transporter I [Mariannaea sp. PMI_226]